MVGAGGTATGTLGNTVGSLGGEEAHAPTISETANHYHPGSSITAEPVTVGGGGSDTVPLQSGSGTTFGDLTIASQGGGNPFNVMQPSMVVLFQVKY